MKAVVLPSSATFGRELGHRYSRADYVFICIFTHVVLFLSLLQVPVRLPAVAMKAVVLPSSATFGRELGHRYSRADYVFICIFTPFVLFLSFLQVPVRLPAVAMKAVVLPSSATFGRELGHRYSRADCVHMYLYTLCSLLFSSVQVPVRLPAVAMKAVVLPSSATFGRELGHRYSRALVNQAYKLLPSSAAFGDPYGLLRKLKKGWLRYRHEVCA